MIPLKPRRASTAEPKADWLADRLLEADDLEDFLHNTDLNQVPNRKPRRREPSPLDQLRKARFQKGQVRTAAQAAVAEAHKLWNEVGPFLTKELMGNIAVDGNSTGARNAATNALKEAGFWPRKLPTYEGYIVWYRKSA